VSIRVIVFVIFLLNFIFGIITYLSIPANVLHSMDSGERLLLIQSLITSFALVLLSYWVWRDGENNS
jgi:hypothetical protein